MYVLFIFFFFFYIALNISEIYINIYKTCIYPHMWNCLELEGLHPWIRPSGSSDLLKITYDAL